MRIQIDRDLPVAVATQLQGQIEYGVSNGDFPPGSRLPSVRELASELAVSPVTVSQAYRSLQAKGLIESMPGSGTYVRESAAPPVEPNSTQDLDRLIAQSLRAAQREGMSRSELLERVHLAITQTSNSPAVRLVLVGVYPAVTRDYAADLRRHLRHDDRVATTTFDALASGDGMSALAKADLALTFAHRRAELEERVPDGVVVAPLNLIPSERTRVALAAIHPLARVVLTSAIPEFLATLRRGVARFASHVESLAPVLWGAPGCEEALANADVVVYGTGTEAVLESLPGHVRAIEYRHAPDPIHIERALLPLIDRRRAVRSSRSPNTSEVS